MHYLGDPAGSPQMPETLGNVNLTTKQWILFFLGVGGWLYVHVMKNP